MIVVSDASPLICLAAIGHLELLHRLYTEVLIPDEVHREITATAPDAPGAREVEAAKWIRVQPIHDRDLIKTLSREVDSGEAAAIVLAIEMKAGLLLIDERRGRKVATRYGQEVIGVLGVLIEAKHRGHLPAVRPLLELLVTETDFRVSVQLYARVLGAAGE